MAGSLSMLRTAEHFGTEKQFPIGLRVLVFVRCIEVLGMKPTHRKYRK